MGAETQNRPGGAFDGALHLLDRQIIDSEDRLVGKVDDVELTETSSGLVVTGMLTGPAALLDRLGGRLGSVLVERWGQLRPTEPDRTRPWRVDLALVDRLDSALHLSVPRAGVLRRDQEERRLGRLVGMHVVGPDGTQHGRVLDARFRSDGGAPVLVGLIVGRGGPGSLLGYERRPERGPAIVRAVVLRRHRDMTLVDAGDATIEWETRTVRVATAPSGEPGHPFDL